MSGRVVTLGETMGLFRPSFPGAVEHAAGFELGVGGAESNVAIGVSRLGGQASWMGRVGDDGIGRKVTRELRGEGVDVRCRVDLAARTGLMVKETPVAHLTRVSYYRAGSAGSRLDPSDVDRDLIEQAAVLHVSGITSALSDTAAAAVQRAVDIATSAGVPISFDVNHRQTLWAERDPTPSYRALARRSSLIFAGADEATLLVGDAAPLELARRLAALGPRHAVVKLGAEGCAAIIEGREYVLPAIPVQAVDTVGAGDAFVAGYLSGVLDGAEPAACLELARQCGAFACLGPGDWESYPRRADLLALAGAADPVQR